jgi:hypothetical protein
MIGLNECHTGLCEVWIALHGAVEPWYAGCVILCQQIAAAEEGCSGMLRFATEDHIRRRLGRRIALQVDQPAEARRCQEQADAALAGLGGKAGSISAIQRGEYQRFCGRVALFHSDWAAAQTHLRESEAIFRGLGNRYYQGRIAFDQGLLAASQGEPQRAQLHWREAGLLFRSVGARLDARRAESALTRLSVR